MLDQLQLVHLNGRVYDPLVARFVSADPEIQDPMHSQSYNRYTYVWNNPTNDVDPTGFEDAPSAATPTPGAAAAQMHASEGWSTVYDAGSVQGKVESALKNGQTIIVVGSSGVMEVVPVTTSGTGTASGANAGSTIIPGAGTQGSNPASAEQGQEGKVQVTGSGDSKFDSKSRPDRDVVADKGTLGSAYSLTNMLDNTAPVETGFLVGKSNPDGPPPDMMKVVIQGTKCTDHTCDLPMPGALPHDFAPWYVSHVHVPDENFPYNTFKRKNAGPGDHAVLVMYGVPNVIKTTDGKIGVLEFTLKDGYTWSIINEQGERVSTKPWQPSDAEMNRREYTKFTNGDLR